MKKPFLLAALLTLGVSFSASAQETAPAAEKRFKIEGKIVSVRPAAKTAVIDAKAIPGYMSAMPMPYAFKDSVELAKLKTGDYIKADLVVNGSKSLVEKVVVSKDTAAKK